MKYHVNIIHSGETRGKQNLSNGALGAPGWEGSRDRSLRPGCSTGPAFPTLFPDPPITNGPLTWWPQSCVAHAGSRTLTDSKASQLMLPTARWAVTLQRRQQGHPKWGESKHQHRGACSELAVLRGGPGTHGKEKRSSQQAGRRNAVGERL